MRFTKLGKSGVKVSRLCLGTMNFGMKADENESFRIMDAAIEFGINFFDTANRYGGTETERIVGRWMKKTGKRDDIFLATKFFGPMGDGANDEGLSAYHMRHAVEGSLERLQTDRIDLYQMHHIDRGTPHFRSELSFLGGDRENLSWPAHLKGGTTWDEIWQGYHQLIMAGKVLYAGSSNFAGWNVAQANERARTRNMLGLISEQSKYNLMTRDIELEMVPACREYGLGILPWSPLAGGALAGDARSDGNGRRSAQEYSADVEAQRKAFAELSADIGSEPAVVALAWLIHNPVVTAPIIGPRTVAQLESAAAAVELKLSDETLGKLDEIFPGPGDQAPEAYAW